MGIFSRLNTVIKSNLNSLVDKAEDPEKLTDQLIIDMKSELKKARRELVQTLGAAKRLDKDAKELEEEVERWEKKAILALKKGDEDLAREALKFKAKTVKKAEAARNQAATNQKRADDMKAQLEEIEQKIDDLEARKASLAASVRKARAVPGDDTDTGAFGELQRMAGKIDELDAEAEVHGLLDDGSADLDAKFRALKRKSGDQAVEDELASLKATLDD